jgi:hypothetical protein
MTIDTRVELAYYIWHPTYRQFYNRSMTGLYMTPNLQTILQQICNLSLHLTPSNKDDSTTYQWQFISDTQLHTILQHSNDSLHLTPNVQTILQQISHWFISDTQLQTILQQIDLLLHTGGWSGITNQCLLAYILVSTLNQVIELKSCWHCVLFWMHTIFVLMY